MILKSIIYPSLAAVFRFITTQRNRCYDRGLIKSHRCQLPVISVGNVTVGGNAKTPLCIYLANELKKSGRRPALLSRGYGGRTIGPHLVDSSDSPAMVGDEPLLLLRHAGVPVVIARNRIEGSRYIEKHGIADLIILDDGFQHRRLARNIDIVSIDVGSRDAIDRFCRGAILPLGLFREDRDAALKRVDIIILSTRRPLSESDRFDQRVLDLLPPGKAVFRSCIEPEMPIPVGGGEELRPGAVVAFCGIAGPEGFFMTLKSLGFDLKAEIALRDHHVFSGSGLKRIRKDYPNLPLICTEKDAIKLESLITKERGIYYLPIKTVVNPQRDFMAKLGKILS